MNFLTLFSTLFLASSSLALPLNERTLEDRQSNGIVYLRAKTNVASRLEIRQLHDTQPQQYNLFIVALDRWMKKPASDPTSYFAIASIHGVPRDNYNNVNECGNCGGADGYAVHDSVLFPPWHRAYIALFEQELTAVAKQVATEYPASQRATMQKAANALRLPYYDAAAMPKQGSPAMPNLLTDFTVVVNGPQGRVSLTNPLFRYSIPNPSGFVYQYFTTWDRTLRYPNTNAANAASQPQLAKNAFTNIRQGLADQFYSLFTNCHDWLHFSNDRAGSSIPSCSTSVEDIHNAIHTAIGGGGDSSTGLSGGHMTYLPVSSFDPSFWLHHSNIDRMFAMWQTLNPNSWGASMQQPTGSWTIAQGTTVGPASALTPFMRQQGGGDGNGGSGPWWTSDLVRNWRNLGYTYPEYAHSSGSAQDITRYINNLYGPNANAVAGSSKRDLVGDIVGAATDAVDNVMGSAANEPSGNSDTNPIEGAISRIVNTTLAGVTSTAESMLGELPIPIGSALAATNGSTYQYVANIYTPRYALNGTYYVYLFNKQPSTDQSAQWIFQENLIGFMGVLSKPGLTDNDMIASGSIPLTRTLQNLTPNKAASPLLQDLTEDVVVPYLTENLVWRVAGLDGEIDPSTIPGFVVSVYASSAPQVAEDQLPLWSDFIPLLDVTKDRTGGASTLTDMIAPQSGIGSVLSSLS